VVNGALYRHENSVDWPAQRSREIQRIKLHFSAQEGMHDDE
jgi:hypothetical protein